MKWCTDLITVITQNTIKLTRVFQRQFWVSYVTPFTVPAWFRVQGGVQPVWQGWRRYYLRQWAGHCHALPGSQPDGSGTSRHGQRGGRRRWVRVLVSCTMGWYDGVDVFDCMYMRVRGVCASRWSFYKNAWQHPIRNFICRKVASYACARAIDRSINCPWI